MNIPFETTELNSQAIAIQQQENIRETYFFKAGDVEIQDLSSQMTGDYFHAKAGESWYDCCAASGGKSLLLHSMIPGVALTVSDSRKSVLQNLKLRFDKAGIEAYFSCVADLEKPLTPELQGKKIDGIILDAPCSGSGTWGRNPENLQQCTEQSVQEYAKRQKQIALSVSTLLKPGGKMVYITCSAFKAENEEVVDFICSNTKLKLEESKVIQGTEHGADSMFVARLKMG
jgi:16S rRNA (cytosine967-C5)-methyltransferase